MKLACCKACPAQATAHSRVHFSPVHFHFSIAMNKFPTLSRRARQSGSAEPRSVRSALHLLTAMGWLAAASVAHADGSGTGASSWIGYMFGGNQATGPGSAVAAGLNNLASGQSAFVGAGSANQANGISALVIGGFDNRANAIDSIVVAGAGNRANGLRSVVIGGGYNLASGPWSFIGGGGRDGVVSSAAGTTALDHIAAGKWATIGGGVGNRAGSLATQTGATVAGGDGNQALNTNATVSGGTLNLASAVAATIAGGHFNRASGVASAIAGGSNNIASADYAGVGGLYSESNGVGGFVWGIGSRQVGGGSALGRNLRADGTDTHVTGQGVWALRDNGWGSGWNNVSNAILGFVSGHQANDRGILGANARAIGSFVHTGDEGIGVGDAQRIELIMRTVTTDASPKQLSVGSSPAAISPNVTVLTVPENGSLRVSGGVVARDATGASRSWELLALIKNVGGTVVLVGSKVTPEFGDTGAVWGFDVAADNANDSLALIATGQAGRTIQWVARLISIENVSE
jgi:hypothetical protein